ncbi:MAG: hypothetical protein JST16_15340 [Bdellovibrionales bacterium]|nr:hypothetical protein [Bdellovibrionales bacterium]
MRFTDGQTKKELRFNGLSIVMIAAVAVLAQSNLAMAGSKDGASLGQQVQQEAAAQGRALLTIEDLKTLLGMGARDPSAVGTSRLSKDSQLGSYDFAMKLSAEEKKTLAHHIQVTELKRAELVARLEKDARVKKEEVRKQRRAVQAQRIGSAGNSDEALSMQLFDSILEESNLDSKVAREVANFDEAHMVALNFEATRGSRIVNAIEIGSKQVWAFGGDTRVAQK